MTGPSPEQLRQNIVRAAIPLISEYDTLTTAQIAQAAGIEEIDLVAVFPDKEAVIQACIEMMTTHLSTVMDPTDEIGKLDAIRVDQQLASRLIEVLGVVDAYCHRVRADLNAFEQFVVTGTGTTGAPSTQSSGRKDLRFLSDQPEFRQAVTRLLEPDAQRLRLPAEALAEAFLTMSTVGARSPNEERLPLPAEQVVDLFLHGALS